MAKDRGYRWEEIGSRIREARTKVGLTQERVGELVGVKGHTVWCWEAGRMKPNHEHLVELALHCETSIDRLLGRDVVESEILEETEASFRDAVAGLPMEDVEAIRDFIRFVRERRRRKRARG